MTTETLTTQAAQTNEGQSQAAVATPAAAQEQAAATVTESQSQSVQQQQQVATQHPPDGQTETTEKTTEQKPEGAPESYDFKAPEGVLIDEQVFGTFSEVAKELNLSQDQAQLVLDKMAPMMAQRQMDQVQAARAQWQESSKADKEFGGQLLQESLAHAKTAMDAFATPELKGLLEESGLGNHPEVVRFFVRAGKAISEDRFVLGRAGTQATGDARQLYSASNMNP